MASRARSELPAFSLGPIHYCLPFELSVSGKAGARVGALANLALSASATHGGELVVVGAYAAELVVEGKELVAYVFDASGKASAAADLGLELELGASCEPHRR